MSDTDRHKMGKSSLIPPVRAELHGIVAERLANAEAAIKKIGENYPALVEADVARMQSALDEARRDPASRRAHLEDLFDVCHNLKGQGATFGYQLVTDISQSLGEFLKGNRGATEADQKIVQAHILALKTVIDNRIEGDGEEMGRRLVDRLTAMTTKPVA